MLTADGNFFESCPPIHRHDEISDTLLNSRLDYSLCYDFNVDLLVHATCVVALLPFIMSSASFEKTKVQLPDKTEVLPCYKLKVVKVVSSR